jgi:hypothetical protein
MENLMENLNHSPIFISKGLGPYPEGEKLVSIHK